MSHFNVSLIVWAKSQDSVHKPHFFEEKRKESRSESNQGPSAYQLSALPLGKKTLLIVCMFPLKWTAVMTHRRSSASARKFRCFHPHGHFVFQSNGGGLACFHSLNCVSSCFSGVHVCFRFLLRTLFFNFFLRML